MLTFYLVVEKDIAGEQVFHLQSRHTIGRAPETDRHLSDLSVSRQHALVFPEDEKALLEYAGNPNGTHVHEERLLKGRTTTLNHLYRQIVKIIKVNRFCSCSKR
jgi:pSer/pThr/pTyr-binding forkhead associated (FHA) protein